MAEDKKSILVYADWISIFEELEDAEAGKLIKHFFRYVNDMNPEAPDRLTKLLFEPIKQTLKRDLVKYEEKRETNRQNALIRWDKEHTTASDRMPSDANHADSDSDSDSDSGSDSEKRIEKRRTLFTHEVFSFSSYPKEMLDKFINYWIELNRSKTKMKFELEKTFEISRRLVTWSSREKDFIKQPLNSTLTYDEILKISEKNPDIWKQYTSVKREGERKAVFILKT